MLVEPPDSEPLGPDVGDARRGRLLSAAGAFSLDVYGLR